MGSLCAGLRRAACPARRARPVHPAGLLTARRPADKIDKLLYSTAVSPNWIEADTPLFW